MADPRLETLLEVATEAAWAGGRCTLRHFNAGVAVELKADRTPVTAADRESEAAIRAVIGRAFPDHAILGEEEGETAGAAPYRWIIDPLDGTRTFVRGVPLYGTLVGLEVRGAPTVGVVYLPALGETVRRGARARLHLERCAMPCVGNDPSRRRAGRRHRRALRPPALRRVGPSRRRERHAADVGRLLRLRPGRDRARRGRRRPRDERLGLCRVAARGRGGGRPLHRLARYADDPRRRGGGDQRRAARGRARPA